MAQDSDKPYVLLYNKEGVETIERFIEVNHIKGITAQELFDLNKNLIWSQYTEIDRGMEKEITSMWPTKADDLTVNSWLPASCCLKVYSENIEAETAIVQTNQQVKEKNFCVFASEKIQDILQNEGYVAISETSTKQSPSCTVIGWHKSLRSLLGNKAGSQFPMVMSTEDLEEFANLSSYVISLNTSVSKNGGSFSLRLPIIRIGELSATIINPKGYGNGALNMAAGWDAVSLTPQKADSNNNRLGKPSQKPYFSKTAFSLIKHNYFEWLISSNDILFMSFEKLEMEGAISDRKAIYAEDPDVLENSKLKLSQGVFDMIGLVDEVRVVTDASSSSAYVEITGRDLMKLLIEDGSFFFQTSTVAQPSLVFANDNGDDRYKQATDGMIGNWAIQGDYVSIVDSYNPHDSIRRLRRLSGEIDIFTNRINMTIEYVIKGIMSKLANIEVAPSHVFESWGADRTTFKDFTPEDSYEL